MAITNGYCTLQEVKDRLRITTTDAARDAMIEAMIEAASRWIDGWCGRRFYAAAEVRYYTARWDDVVYVDDVLSITALQTDNDGDRVYETTWAEGDYDLLPFNASLIFPPAPYTRIERAPQGAISFPVCVARGVKVTGSWGYASAAPPAVSQACAMMALRLYERKDTVLGMAGAAALGQLMVRIPTDPDVLSLLEPYRRLI